GGVAGATTGNGKRETGNDPPGGGRRGAGTRVRRPREEGSRERQGSRRGPHPRSGRGERRHRPHRRARDVQPGRSGSWGGGSGRAGPHGDDDPRSEERRVGKGGG